MVLNGDKCHFMWLGKNKENETFVFNNFIFNDNNEEIILRITQMTANQLSKFTLKFYVKKLKENRGFIKAIKSSK